MPALPAAPQVLRVEHFFNVGADANAKVRNFMKYSGTAPTNSDLTAVATFAVGEWHTSGCDALQSVDSQLDSITIVDLSSSTAAIGSAAGPVPGTRAGEPPSADACLLTSSHVARRFRGGHYREYWPLGTVNDLLTAQTWTAAFLAAAATALDAFGAAVRGSGWPGFGSLTKVGVSYYTGFMVHTGTTGRARNVSLVRPVPDIDVVTSRTYQAGIASQRKRLLRLA